MAKTSIADEIEHHPQFCLDLSDPLGAIRMGNSIGRFGDRHPVPALGFNARDRYFHFRRTFDEGLHAFVENAFESRVRYRYSLSWPHPNIGISYHGAAGRSPPVFCRERGGITGPETIRPDRILPEGLWLFAVLRFLRAIDLIVSVRWITARFSYRSRRDYVAIHGDGVDHPRLRPAFPESRLLTGAGVFCWPASPRRAIRAFRWS